jgi:ribosomal 50S subunit-associated protein YjgA (DUF615 family)
MMGNSNPVRDRLLAQQRTAATVQAEIAEVRRLQAADLVALMRWQQAQTTANEAFTAMIETRSELTQHLVALERARVDLVAETAEIQAHLIQRSMQA